VRQEFAIADEQHDSQAMKLVRGAVRRGIAGHEDALAAAVEAAFGKVVDALAGGWVPGDVSAEEADGIFRDLEGRGLVAGRGRMRSWPRSGRRSASPPSSRSSGSPREAPGLTEFDIIAREVSG
jgi:hypothetical protein